jgi:hypothetical protein
MYALSVSHFLFNSFVAAGLERSISMQRGRCTILLILGPRDAGHRARRVIRRQPLPCRDRWRGPQRSNL